MSIVSEDDESELFLSRLVQFSQLLRSEGLTVTPAETLDMTSAISLTGLSRLEEFRDALRTTLVKKSDDYERFNFLFAKFWLRPKKDPMKMNPLGRISIPKEKIARTVEAKESNQIGRGRVTAGSMYQSPAPDASPTDKLLAVYSPFETQSRKSFADLNAIKDRLVLKRSLKSFARATATLPGRRYAISRGTELDFRRTLRNNLKTGGNAIEIELRSNKITKSRIVVLADISGSMDGYSKRILKLLYHLSNTIHGSTVFGFSTRVVPLNRYLQGKSLRQATDLITTNVDAWSSGTRIGSALTELLANYPGVLRSSTIFVVISDGWELGDLDTFKAGLREIRRRVRKLVWLNPQADSPDYLPLAEGMKLALPFIDVFAGLDVFTDRKKFKAAFGVSASPKTFTDPRSDSSGTDL
ncbi:MAG: VWA domain-containing protein [Thaumarchaeota archaeon]|nr:VWA domain-containing protein [Nitrososphaerota archaeon]